MRHWRVFLMLAAGMVAGAAFVCSCGGGGGGGNGGEDGGCTGGTLNSLFSGDYKSFVFLNRDDGGGSVMLYDITSDGIENAIAYALQGESHYSDTTTVNLSYAITGDRTMCLGPKAAGPLVTTNGIIKNDGSILAMTDTDGGASLNDIELGVHIVKSSLASTAGIAGDFIVGQIKGEGSVSRIRATINSDAANGTWEVLASENISEVGNTSSLAFVFSSDSTFTVNVGGTVMKGVISPDRNMFAWGDTIWPRHMAVGVRMSTAGTPDGVGYYVINQMGSWSPATTPESYVSRTDLTTGVSTFDYHVTANSRNPLDSGSGIAYTVSADGTVRFPDNTGWVANLSPDGQVMVLVDSDPNTANDVHVGVAIKK